MAGHAHSATRSLNGGTSVEEPSSVEDYPDLEARTDPPADDAISDAPDADGARSESTERLDAERGSSVRLAIALGAAVVVALGGVVGWLGYRTHQAHQVQAQHEMFVEAARTGAVNLTTFGFDTTDADIQRILDSTTGSFHSDFQTGAEPFVAVIKQAQSRSEGTVTRAGLESQEGDSAQVLVAVSVKTSNAGAPEQEPRAWRMRIGVQKVDDGAKVSAVTFVP